MKFVVVALLDCVAEVYAQPAFVASAGAAIRGLSDEVNRVDPKNPLHVHADDFQLHLIGSYDDATGIIEPSPPRAIAMARDLRK